MQRNILRVFPVVFSLMLLTAPAFGADFGYTGDRPIVPADHVQHPMGDYMYAEQWSGTIVFGKKHYMTFNLNHSNLTTKGKKATFRVEYNTPDGKKVVDKERCTIQHQAEPMKLVCGNALILGDAKEFKLRFKGEKHQVVMKLTSLSKPFRPKDGRLRGGDAKEFYDFMLMIPRGKAIVKLNGQVLNGYGSVDHSYANTGYQNISRHWVATTYHDDQVSIVFAANMNTKGQTTAWAAVTDNEGNAFASADLKATLSDNLEDKDKKGYFTFKTIDLKSTTADGFRLLLQNLALLKKRSMLANLSSVEKFVVKRFADPMRYSMGGTAAVTWPTKAGPKQFKRDVIVLVKQMDDE